MSLIRITRKLEFDAGHRVLNHESKCANLHGHRYVAEVTIEAPKLDSVGRVIDFSVVKQILGGWIDREWDHNMILNAADPLAGLWTPAGTVNSLKTNIFNDKPPFIMPCHAPNPTAENMAEVLAFTAMDLLPKPLQIVHVRLYETPNCWADWFTGTKLGDGSCPYS